MLQTATESMGVAPGTTNKIALDRLQPIYVPGITLLAWLWRRRPSTPSDAGNYSLKQRMDLCMDNGCRGFRKIARYRSEAPKPTCGWRGNTASWTLKNQFQIGARRPIE